MWDFLVEMPLIEDDWDQIITHGTTIYQCVQMSRRKGTTLNAQSTNQRTNYLLMSPFNFLLIRSNSIFLFSSVVSANVNLFPGGT